MATYADLIGQWGDSATAPVDQYNSFLNTGLPVEPMPAPTTTTVAAPAPAPTETPEQQQIRLAQEAADAEAARKAAQAAALKTGITGIINNIKGVYDSIYGDIDTSGKEQTRALTERNQAETTSLNNQFQGEFPKIGNAYSSRGAYDSSYRMDAEEGAARGFQDQLNTLGIGYREDLSKIGQRIAQDRAKVQAGKGDVDAILARINESNDPAELTDLRNTLDSKLRSLQADRAGYGTQEQYLNQLNQVAPANDRIASLTSSLTNVINSAIPSALKRAIGTQLITNAALPPEQANALLGQLSTQLATDDQKQVA